jgi:Xaa-Pro aminopeptidase
MMEIGELRSRIAGLQSWMAANHCEGFLIIQNVDLYYFSGTTQSAQLYVPVAGDPVLFCRKSQERARNECPWQVVAIDNFKAIPDQLSHLSLAPPRRLALEFDVIPVSTYLTCVNLFPKSEIIDGAQWIRNVRAVKSAYEINLLKISGQKTAELYSQIPAVIKSGKSEMDCAVEIEKIARTTRHEGIVRLRGFNQELFFGYFLSGESGAIGSFNDGATGGPGMGPFYPQGGGEKLLKAGEPIYLDYIGVYNAYNVDWTRVFVIGSLPDHLYRAFQTALDIQSEVVAKVKPGVSPAELWETALAKARTANLRDRLQGYGSSQVRFVGHGIGLEVDEWPVLAKGFNAPLEEGMVFALEPKFVFPGEGIVGIENTWAVTANGAERITVFPDDLVVIPDI